MILNGMNLTFGHSLKLFSFLFFLEQFFLNAQSNISSNQNIFVSHKKYNVKYLFITLDF